MDLEEEEECVNKKILDWSLREGAQLLWTWATGLADQ
jgi:hypothetical protein